MLSKLPKKNFLGDKTNKLIGDDEVKDYNRTVLISGEQPLSGLKIENIKPTDNHSDGAIDTKDIQIDQQEVQGGEDYKN